MAKRSAVLNVTMLYVLAMAVGVSGFRQKVKTVVETRAQAEVRERAAAEAQKQRIAKADPTLEDNTHGVCSWAANGEGSGTCRENKNQGDCEMGMGEVCMWVENGQSFDAAHESWRHKAGKCIGDAPKDNGPCGRARQDDCVNDYYKCHWEINEAEFTLEDNTHGVCSWAANGEGSGTCRENKNQGDCQEGMGEVCMWVENGQSDAAAHESWRHKAGKCIGDAPKDNGACGRAGRYDCVNDYYKCHWEINEAELTLEDNTHGVCSWAANGEGSGTCRENKNQGDCEEGMGEVCMWVENGQSDAAAHESWRHKAGKCIGDAPKDNGACGRAGRSDCVNDYYECHWEINEAELTLEDNTHGVCSWAANGEGSEDCHENQNQGDCEMGMGEVCMWVENGQSDAAAHESWRQKAGKCVGDSASDNGPCGRAGQEDCKNDYYECHWEINPNKFNAAEQQQSKAEADKKRQEEAREQEEAAAREAEAARQRTAKAEADKRRQEEAREREEAEAREAEAERQRIAKAEADKKRQEEAREREEAEAEKTRIAKAEADKKRKAEVRERAEAAAEKKRIAKAKRAELVRSRIEERDRKRKEKAEAEKKRKAAEALQCKDKHKKCGYFLEKGYCENKRWNRYLSQMCKKSCKYCIPQASEVPADAEAGKKQKAEAQEQESDPSCKDTHRKCDEYKPNCERSDWKGWMGRKCKKTCNLC